MRRWSRDESLGVKRGLRGAFTAVAALVLAASCALDVGDDASGGSDNAAKTDARQEALRSAREAPDFPPEAVVGVIQRLEGGRVVHTAVRDNHPKMPPNLDELLSRGGTDEEGFVYSDVAGAYSDDGVNEVRYQFVTRRKFGAATDEDKRPNENGTRVGPPVLAPRLSPEAEAMLKSSDPGETVEIYARLKQPFETRLVPSSGLGSVSMAHAEEQRLKKRASIAARKAEAAALQASFLDLLREKGGSNIGGFWTSNGVGATVPAGALPELAAHADVEEISLSNMGGEELSTTDWDGDDMKASTGLNAGVYHDQGFTGQAYADNFGGRHMRIAVIGGGFDLDHPGFLDCVGCASRVAAYQCITSPCTTGSFGPAPHGTRVAGIAAGSIRQNQIPGYSNQQELERSGVTEEAEPIQLIEIGLDQNHVKRAIELAVEHDVDVMVCSTKLNSTPCNGYAGSNVEATIHTAQQQGMIFVQAAGNDGDPGSCNLLSMAEAPSAFLVGALANNSSECTKNNYSTCPIWPNSSRGGMDAVINGFDRTAALSAIDVMAPACPYYAFNTTGGISIPGGCGTSYATPQVGGAAILIKDWFMDQGYTAIAIEGRLFAVLLAMSDRADADGVYRTSSFGDRWGGGRFQARFHNSADMGGSFNWTTYSVIHTSGTLLDSPLWAGPASSNLNQFKVYTMVFEDDAVDVSDFLLYVRDEGCGSGSATLGSDLSYDVKKMVRLSSSAAGDDLCIRTYANHIPLLQSRRIHVYAYYSAGTTMR